MSARRDRALAALRALGPEGVFSGVAWRQRGAGRWRGACPLHGGDGPSLSVDARNLTWTCHSAHCHGSDRGAGDAFDWLAYRHGAAPAGARLDGSAFREALALAERLCGLADGALPPPRPAPAAARREAERASAAQLARARVDAFRWAVRDLAEGGPGWAYLARERRAWELGRPLADAALGWADRDALAPLTGSRGPLGRGYALPPGAAGVLAFPFTSPRSFRADAWQLEALTAEGLRTSPRWRRSLGATAGLVFDVPGRWPGDVLALCEGPLDALALSHCPCVAVARAVGGTAGMRAAALDGWRGPVVVHADADDRGRLAARMLALDVATPARPVAVQEHPAGDAAAALAARIEALASERGGPGEAWAALPPWCGCAEARPASSPVRRERSAGPPAAAAHVATPPERPPDKARPSATRDATPAAPATAPAAPRARLARPSCPWPCGHVLPCPWHSPAAPDGRPAGAPPVDGAGENA